MENKNPSTQQQLENVQSLPNKSFVRLRQFANFFKNNHFLRFSAGVGILLVIGTIGFLAYKSFKYRPQVPETMPTPVVLEPPSAADELDIKSLCDWIPPKRSGESPLWWSGWYLDKSVIPSTCKSIQIAKDLNPNIIPFKSKEECIKTCSQETTESPEEKYPLKKIEIAEAGYNLYQSIESFTYIDLPYRFSINLPKNYFLKIGNGREIDTQISNANIFENQPKEWFILNVGSLYPGYSHEGISQNNLEEFVKTFLKSPTEIVQSTDLVFNGKKAKKVTYKLYGFDNRREVTSIFLRRDRFYWFSCSYSSDNSLKQCEELINTIKLTD